jgi:ribonuclease E
MTEHTDTPEENNKIEPVEGTSAEQPATRPKSRRRRPRARKPVQTPANAETAGLSTSFEVAVTPVHDDMPVADNTEAAEGPKAQQGTGKSRRRRRPRSRKVNPNSLEKQDAALTVAGDDSIAPIIEYIPATPDSADTAVPGEQTGTGKSRRRRRRPRKGSRPEGAPLASPERQPAGPPVDRTKRILINANYADEKRVAIVEGDSLIDFYIEATSRIHLKGNIYKATVSSVMAGLQAVFVDFGQKKHGFLQFHDIMPEIYASAKDGGHDRKNRVQDALVKGQEILVQVTKDEHGTKGASLTTYISIPGRYIVMMPGQTRVGISRKIEGREDRGRLKETFNSLKLPPDTGFILRTACSDSLEEELSRDLKYLTKLWAKIKADAAKSAAPALIYQEQDIAMRTVRDYLTTDVAEVLIDDPKTCTATKAFLKKIMPWRTVKVTQYKDKKPLFALHNIEAQISGLSKRTVMLPSKGYLVFDKTEALTAIDVNSGRSRKEDNAESTALNTNLEAAREVARQLRLRDIGGLVVIDFIDVENARNRKLLETTMMESLSMDKASTEVASLSRFCILEMTRERLRPAYAEAISRICPLCEGKGAVNSDAFVAISAMRELHATAAAGKDDITGITCKLGVESANLLLNARKKELVALEQEYDIAFTVIADQSMPAGHYSIDVQKKK